MSLSQDGRTLTCDGPGAGRTGCPHTMRPPIGLRQLLRPNQSSPTNGWLCVVGSEGTRHYCPDCAPGFLKSSAPVADAPVADAPVADAPVAEWIGEEPQLRMAR